MIRILYDVMGSFWPVTVQRSKSSRALDDDDDDDGQGAAGDDQGLDAEAHELNDGDDNDLAESLVEVLQAQPVVPLPDSQVPPDSLDQPEFQSAHHDEEPQPDQPVYLVPEFPEPELSTPVAADLPQPTSSADADSQITPTELEATPERMPSNASGVPVVEVLESPPVKDSMNTKTMDPKDDDLESVQARIAKLK